MRIKNLIEQCIICHTWYLHKVDESRQRDQQHAVCLKSGEQFFRSLYKETT